MVNKAIRAVEPAVIQSVIIFGHSAVQRIIEFIDQNIRCKGSIYKIPHKELN